MAVDPTVLSMLDTSHARGIAASAGFFEQHMAMVTASASLDQRTLSGFLNDQLFETGLVQSKAAYHTPVEPGLSPPPSK